MLDKFLIQPIISHAEKFSIRIFNSLAPFSLALLESLCLLWVLWTIYNALIIGKFDWQNILKKILIFCIIGSILAVNNKLFYEYIYNPIKETTTGLVDHILSINPTDPQSNSRRDLNANKSIQEVDQYINKLISLIMLVSKKASFFAAIYAAIISCIIWGLFVIAEAMFALYLVGNTLKLAAIGALSPLLILTFAFEHTRSYAVNGLKYVLTSALTLIVAAFCMALVLIALKNLISSILVDNISSDFEVFSALTTLLVLALSSVYFLKLAPEFASTIIGVAGNSSIISNVLGGFMGGATSMIPVVVAKTPVKSVQYAANAAVKTVYSAVKFASNYFPTKETK